MSDQTGTTDRGFWEGDGGGQALKRCQNLVNTVSDGIYRLDADGRFVAVDDGVVAMTGYARGDLLGEHVSVLLDDPAVRRIEDVIRGRLGTGAGDAPYDIVVETADGDRIPCELHVNSLVDGDEFEGTVGVVRDVTGQKESQRKLEESERRYRTLVENFPNGAVALVDEDLRYRTVGGNPLDVADITAEEVEGKPVRGALPPELADKLVPCYEAAFEGDASTFQAESNGRTYRFQVVPVRDDDGDVFAALGMSQDITEREEQERALERALDLLERTERVADVGGWEIDTESMDVFWTDHTFDLLEVDADEEPPLDGALDMYHAEDRQNVQAAVETALDSGEPFDVEARVRTGGGDVRWLHLQGVPETVDGDVVSLRGAAQDITGRKRREQRLEESEARFRMLAENLEEMIWISDPETRDILYLNPAYEKIWGRDRESLCDDPITFLGSVHPHDRERVERAYAAVPDERFDEEYRIVRPDGEVRWLDIRAETVRSEGRERVVGIAEDITERKERQRALEESERRYRTLVENFPNGAVGLYNQDLKYTAAGGKLLDATGIEPEDRVGSTVYDIYPDELVDEVEPYFHAALEGESNSFEVEFYDRHLYAYTLPVRNADDEVFAGMIVVQDVTERREYERKLEESNERLEQFAYAASHDLQEPLRMVSSYLQLVESRYADELDEDGREFIEFAVDGAERMRDMIQALLQYSRVDTQGDPFEPVDLDEVFADVRQDLQVKIRESDADITAEDLPTVYGDRSQLNQVLQNLLDNAIEYSGDEPPRVHVGVERADDQWVVSVSDEGVGIDPVDAEKVFEVFQSLQGHEDAGTGIGLALVERIVERHDGDVWVDSAPGEGATFSFTVPVAGDIRE